MATLTMEDVTQVEVKLLFDLKKRQLLVAARTSFELLIESVFWKALFSPSGMQKRRGFLGVAGVAAVPKGDLEPEVFRVEIQDRLKQVLKFFFGQDARDYDTVTGRTKYGPFKFGLTIGFELDIVTKRLKSDLPRLKKIVERERLSDGEQSDGSNDSGVTLDVASLFRGLPDDFHLLTEKLESVNVDFRRSLAAHFQKALNRQLYEILIESPPNSLAAKKKIVAWLKTELDRFGLSIRHPDNGNPCTLITLPGHDEHGLFLLESRDGRKRSHTTADLHSLLDFTLVDSGMGTVEKQRKKGGPSR